MSETGYDNTFENFLRKLAKDITLILRTPVRTHYSGIKQGPMAPWPYYLIATPKRKFLFFEYGEEKPLFVIYSGVSGASRKSKEIFCSVFDDRIAETVQNNLKAYGEANGFDKIYLTSVVN